MRFSRGKQSVSNNDSFAVPIGNYIPVGIYYVNASIGTPKQAVNLQLDTGSSDVWAFGVHSCDTTTSYCLGGACKFRTGPMLITAGYNPNRSSTATVISEGGFEISYVTQGSGVKGNWVKDDFSVGNITITGLSLGVATQAAGVPTGIMGIGFSADESNSTLYPNFVDQMVAQGLTKSRSYSLWLDDLDNSTGSVLFGGYDSDKYHNELVAVPMQPNASGIFSQFAVTWTSLSFTGANGNQTTLSGQDFREYAILDSGTTRVLVPDDIYTQIASAAGVQDDGRVDCALSTVAGTFNFGFGGPTGAAISVPVHEFVLPVIFPNGTRMTDQNGNEVCIFGMEAQNNRPLLLGDTMLRAAYVVYNLDEKWIAMAPTNFNSTTSNITEIIPSSSLPAGWSSAPNISVSQTATGSFTSGGSVPATASGSVTSGSSTPVTASTGTIGFTTAI
ncbi:SAPs pepsin-like proteinases secreted from pathogens to degrade host protein [Aspergillus parasiticus SU-1]|uniref:SAPs pepsin-like proteinases secreted from pathogens to degrade host protein n=1 Tax=Aspergillus parasiticus (strain ATCC 56775 / NRRL 5862 / SRRC 143 / SU-1) TaxID=1403190 RepID=A0A0F0IDB8_ASPPU|nr:SAPs pepsin-like proteinases secreted from pathogens to degrade host protein [Aspergillus parasiticus SU-1]